MGFNMIFKKLQQSMSCHTVLRNTTEDLFNFQEMFSRL